MKHTKREWTAKKLVGSNINGRIIGQETQIICDCYSFSESISDEEATANAKLIAAAPELLEALIEMRDWAVCHGLDIDSKLNLIASIAINKATL